ncbi:helix-turn-helix transcriptional regulator [Clostridium tarantellae]|uniref:Helix-turn-helix domain-containing protein n=1 Tax=Clostridium tarantellae TaxID=39493 RepID=A0A6I1MNI6_9CLOT|nr:helix-turn-helix transcriptional regulator [Clostridium tarantellae]MPQ44594.1 helix-turn-helix domain-containing protein [Clostridium tarantellae]
MEKLLIGLPWYKKIAVLRVIQGWSQKEAAEKCLTHQKVYWVWEKGQRYPRLASRKAIADAYGLKIEDIFSAYDDVVIAL